MYFSFSESEAVNPKTRPLEPATNTTAAPILIIVLNVFECCFLLMFISKWPNLPIY